MSRWHRALALLVLASSDAAAGELVFVPDPTVRREPRHAELAIDSDDRIATSAAFAITRTSQAADGHALRVGLEGGAGDSRVGLGIGASIEHGWSSSGDHTTTLGEHIALIGRVGWFRGSARLGVGFSYDRIAGDRGMGLFMPLGAVALSTRWRWLSIGAEAAAERRWQAWAPDRTRLAVALTIAYVAGEP